MRQSQKTEQQADRLSRIGLENQKYTRARSTDYGEGKGMSVTIQGLVIRPICALREIRGQRVLTI